MGKKKDGLIGMGVAVGPVKHKALADPARPLRLSKESAAKVFDLMEHPPKPSPRLKEAMRRRKKLLG